MKQHALPSEPVKLKFIRDLPLFSIEKPYSIVRTMELPDEESTNIEYDDHDVSKMLRDARGCEKQFSLEKDSFCWVNYPSKINITTEQEMMVPYAKEVNNLLRKIFDTGHVICYDLRWRRNTTFTDEEAFSNSRSVPSPPVKTVHVGLSSVWRPLFRPIEENPIAFCNPSTVQKEDLMEVDRVTPISLIEIFHVKYNPTQEWFWLSNQHPDEVTVFIQYDSHPPDGRINAVPHTTFDDPRAKPGARPRESVETRSIVFTKF
ncbi:hypothetical protein K449DRAFT_401204 [Hypoxylon sp. EC38]|nr:hypothetical protein K449DRAFT_401204 [Hypoxylon sp. EC38]